MRLDGWRPALRIARRSVRRDLKRSILIAALIAAPIAGATVLDGLVRTMTGDEDERFRTVGTADGLATVTGRLSLPGWRPGVFSPALEDKGGPAAERERDPASVDLPGMLPPGSRAVSVPALYGLRLRDGDLTVRTELELFAVGDRLTAHEGRLRAGLLPEGPGQALVSEQLAERLDLLDDDGVRPGATITAENGPAVTVTGVVVDPAHLRRSMVVALPGSVLAKTAEAAEPEPMPQYLVDLPAEADAEQVWPALAGQGVMFVPRAYHAQGEVAAVGPVALIVGFGLLEVVLLAGAAFAVGARRQVRELGLVAANGGTARHVRRIVLAQGLSLGVVGTLAGLALGWLMLVAGTPVWERTSDRLVDGWRFGWAELTVAAVVGVLSGLAAALLPAIGVARMRPVDALAHRFRGTARDARLPVLGVVLLGVGIACVLGSGMLARQAVIDDRALFEKAEAGEYVPLDLTLPTAGVLLGGLAAAVGMIMVTSGLVAALGRAGWRLPLSGRLAVRDAGRHRHRTVPAVMAIMIVIAGSTALGFGLSSTADDVATLPDDSILVSPDSPLPPSDGVAEASFADGTGEVAAELPGGAAHEVRTVVRPGQSPPEATWVELAPARTTALCEFRAAYLAVGTPELIGLATGGRPPAAALATLAGGGVLVMDECLLSDDLATTAPSGPDDRPVRLPARLLAAGVTGYSSLPTAYISAATAKAHGWDTRIDYYLVTHAATASADDIDSALTAAEGNGHNAVVEVDDGAPVDPISLALTAAAALVTLLGVGITVALSAAEGRADLATLAAIGAQPRRRRMLAGAQALVLSGLGTALGLVIGIVLGFAVGPLTGQTAFVPPWQQLALTAVAVPLLAVVIAVVSTRSALPMARRLE